MDISLYADMRQKELNGISMLAEYMAMFSTLTYEEASDVLLKYVRQTMEENSDDNDGDDRGNGHRECGFA